MRQSIPVGGGESEPETSRAAPRAESGDFLLHLSHDLRASLRAIRVNSEMLAKEWAAGDTAHVAQHLSVIVADSVKIEALANGLAGYSIASQIHPCSFVLVSIEVLIRKVLARLGRELKENGAVVTYDPLPRLRCEPDWIGQLFENLLRNALVHRHAPAPRVHVSAIEQGEGWLFGVRDNGPGIEAAYLERIFEPFERLRGQQAPGPGLGLAICRKVVERHGGKMWAESQVGSGATLFFTLPAE